MNCTLFATILLNQPVERSSTMASVSLDDALNYRSKLEKYGGSARSDLIVNILHEILAKDVTLSTITKSKIGIVVKNLQKAENKEVRAFFVPPLQPTTY